MTTLDRGNETPARLLADDELGADLIPRSRYLSRDFLQLEMEKLWPRVWQIACLEQEIPNAGDYAEYQIGRESIIVVRQQDGSVRAHYNSCLHRGTRLVSGCGHVAEFRCPYHAWRWAIDGTLLEVVDRGDFRADIVGEADLQLPGPRIEQWAGFVFVNMDHSAPPLLDYLAPVPERLAKWEIGRMHLKVWQRTRVAANWKTVVDAFNESYHIQGAHSQILPYLDDTAMQYEQFASGHSWMGDKVGATVGKPSARLAGLGFDENDAIIAYAADLVANKVMAPEGLEAAQRMVDEGLPEGETVLTMFAKMKRQAFAERGIDFSHLTDADLVANDDFNIFPNAVGPVLAGSAYIFRMLPDGDEPDSSLLDVWRFERFPNGEEPDVSMEWVDDPISYKEWGSIQEQDMWNLPLIQAGMHSRADPYIRLGRQEGNIRNFHRTLDRYLFT